MGLHVPINPILMSGAIIGYTQSKLAEELIPSSCSLHQLIAKMPRFEKVHDLINSKQCKEGFLSFLKAEHCDELLMLVDKIDETTRLKKTSEIEMANRDIFENFIREGE